MSGGFGFFDGGDGLIGEQSEFGFIGGDDVAVFIEVVVEIFDCGSRVENDEGVGFVGTLGCLEIDVDGGFELEHERGCVLERCWVGRKSEAVIGGGAYHDCVLGCFFVDHDESDAGAAGGCLQVCAVDAKGFEASAYGRSVEIVPCCTNECDVASELSSCDRSVSAFAAVE